MKYLMLFVVFFSISISSRASEITCYRGDKLVYQGKASNIWIGGDYVMFVNSKNKKMYIPGRCVIKSDNSETWG
jgi:hypothetical protein